VTAETIKLVSRRYADSPDNLFIKQAMAQAGAPPEDVTAGVRDVFLGYFNKVYELYGRRVLIEDFKTNASFLEEAQGGGREKACADATVIEQERKAFGVLAFPGGVNMGSFPQCAVEHQLFLPDGTAYYPESWYRRAHPFAWGIRMGCDRTAHQAAEYVGKRLAGKPARFAKDPLYQPTKRVFGLLGFDVGEYAGCADLLEQELERRYGIKIASRYRYGVDASNFAQQSAQATVQFKAAGVTTLILFSDPLTNANLTSQARAQRWGPEWVITGIGGQDLDHYTRLYDQETIDGHLFGLSTLGPTSAIQGPDGEPARLYRQLTGKSLPSGTDGDYFALVHFFNLLQSAGPTLNPEAIASGALSLPPLGGPGFDFGAWSYRTGATGTAEPEHTAVDDAREVLWDADAPGQNGKAGTYIATYGGRRFTNGQWPSEDPPFQPGQSPTPRSEQRSPFVTLGPSKPGL
jgi:hypothetical protein